MAHCRRRTFLTKALRTACATSFSVFKFVKAYSVSVKAAAHMERGRAHVSAVKRSR